MSKSAIKTLNKAEAIIKAAGITVDLVGYLNDGKSRVGFDGKKLWRNADKLAALIVDSAANAFQGENSSTFEENGFSGMAEAIDRYISSNLDSWSQVELEDCRSFFTVDQLARLAEMVAKNDAFEEKETFTPTQPAPFAAEVRQVAQEYNVQLRFAAMMVHTGNYATLRRGAALIAFIGDCKSAYVKAHPEKIVGSGTIADQDHFTAFILSGCWK